MRRPVSRHFIKALNFSTVRLYTQSQKYDGRIFSKIAKWGLADKFTDKSVNFKLTEIIIVLSFHIVKTACYRSGVCEGPGMRLFPNFVKDPAKRALARRDFAMKENWRHTVKLLYIYTFHLYHWRCLRRGGSRENQMQADERNLRSTLLRSAIGTGTTLWSCTLSVTSKRIIYGGTTRICRFSMRTYWGTYNDATLQRLTRYATYLSNL